MSPRRRALLRSGVAAALAGVAGCALVPSESNPGESTPDGTPPDEPTPPDPTSSWTPTGPKVDDWQFDPGDLHGTARGTTTAQPMATGAASADVGLAAGGAKGVGNFRDNVEEGYLPIPSDLSYEGLFYDYYFDAGGGSCGRTFCPRYSTALTADPLSGGPERYVRVGLDSGLDDFERPPLNLVVVLDVSGSMSSQFDEYYYDRFGNRRTVTEHSGRPKIDVATDAVAAMTRQLRPEDRFGMVVFNDRSAVAKPVRAVGETDMDAIRGHVQELEAGGGTRLSAGLADATDLLAEYDDQDRTQRETRTVVVTDAMPNLGETDDEGLRETLAENAAAHHYATFVGVGVDFNTEIVDAITAIQGANYLSVHSAESFRRRLAEEFDYLVTPLVFDLSVTLDAEAHEVAKVYGTTAAEDATGELVRANTLFPSPRRGGRAKGGVILVQLDGAGGDDLALEASWTGRDGRRRTAAETIRFPDGDPDQFGGTAVRKAVLLSRYADLLKNWMIYEREASAVSADGGLSVPPETDGLGEWERQSRELVVSEPYRERIGQFLAYFEREMAAIGDDALERELEVLRTLARWN